MESLDDGILPATSGRLPGAGGVSAAVGCGDGDAGEVSLLAKPLALLPVLLGVTAVKVSADSATFGVEGRGTGAEDACSCGDVCGDWDSAEVRLLGGHCC
mmetsp:Transcript_66277/g.143820  ORF Transcript_66277/g.143820 Transcript_66277/m.143820 type:complete len:100 (-) Transcript_66277:625-924(-)